MPTAAPVRLRAAFTSVIAFAWAVMSPVAAQDKPAPPPAVELVYPNGLALDRAGNLFISDIGAHRVLKLERDGRLTTVAGTGEAGFAGDGGPASQAQLASPMDLAVDADGNLLIADTFNHRVRKVDAQGVITTLV